MSLILENENELKSCAFKILNNMESAEDVLQTVQLRALQSDAEQSLPYLMTAVRNTALKFKRSYAGITWGRPKPTLLDDSLVDCSLLPDAHLMEIEHERGQLNMVAQVRHAMAQLKPRQRRVIEAYLTGLTPYEYARTTGSNKFTEATNFKCGIQKLQKLLGVQRF